MGATQGAAAGLAGGLHSHAGAYGQTLNNLYNSPLKSLGGGESSSPAEVRISQVRVGPDGEPLPPDPHDVVRDAGKVANKYFAVAQQKEKAGKLAEAEKYYSQSLSVRHKIWGDTDPAVIRTYIILGGIEVKLKHYDSAESLYKRAFQSALKGYGMGSYELIPYLTYLGDAYTADQKFSDAANCYQQVRLLKSRKLGDDHKETIVASLKLARAWVGTKDKMYWPDADHLIKANIVSAGKSPDTAAQLIGFLDLDNALLSAEGKTDDAAKVAARADELRAQQPAAAPKPAAAAAAKEAEKPDTSAGNALATPKQEGKSVTPPAAATVRTTTKTTVEKAEQSDADDKADAVINTTEAAAANAKASTKTHETTVTNAKASTKSTEPAAADAKDTTKSETSVTSTKTSTVAQPSAVTPPSGKSSTASTTTKTTEVSHNAIKVGAAPTVVLQVSAPAAVKVDGTSTAKSKIETADVTDVAPATDTSAASTIVTQSQNADPDVVADREQKKVILRHLFDSFGPTWEQFCTDNFVNSDQSEKLAAIAKNPDLTAAQKEQQKEAYRQYAEKKVTRFNELMSEHHLNSTDIALDLCVDAVDSALGWSLDDYRDLDGLTRLVNHSKLKFPAFSGPNKDAEWKAWGEKLGEHLKPSIEKVASTLSPIMQQMKLDEDSGKFGRLTENVPDTVAPHATSGTTVQTKSAVKTKTTTAETKTAVKAKTTTTTAKKTTK